MHPSNTLKWAEVLNRVKASDYNGITPVAPFWLGGDKELCEKLTNLVMEGEKTATASLLFAWEDEGDPLPTIGQRDALLDWNNRFVGIIETTQLEVTPFIDVSAEFASLEGEGDLSLEYWREVHWNYFKRVCHDLGKSITEQVPAVCQVFNLVYSGESPSKPSKRDTVNGTSS